MRDHTLFANIPYAERPTRFEVAQAKKPWAPATLNATSWGYACIGSRVEDKEDEDCLNVNIWVPKGGHSNMPVIVYFHGGINQHGSGSEGHRRGGGIVQNKKYPTIFINFNFRLGIFGWLSLPTANVSDNIGFQDQQALLRWVQEHIAAFGGDPGRVTLQGQSEGCGTILAHVVAPGSAGLFHRCVFHSPVLDFWSRHTNQDRSKFMIKEAGCKKKLPENTLQCLRKKDAQALWGKDFVNEELSRFMGSSTWARAFMRAFKFQAQAKDKIETIGQMGWHAVVDNATLPGEPRELIRQGRFNKVPVLITVSKNESYGVIPNGMSTANEMGMAYLLDWNSLKNLTAKYSESLEARDIHVDKYELENMIITDKVWTCDIRSLAQDITQAGGRAHVGMFWHSPKFDFVGRMTSPVCEKGATCHAAEMGYVLPQTGSNGIPDTQDLAADRKFSDTYSGSFLAFVHGKDGEHPWKAWDSSKPLTFYDSTGTWVVPDYRHEQCDILDKSWGDHVPTFVRPTTVLAVNGTANQP